MNCKQTAALLQERDNILILTHKRPDGDTVGCAVGLCHALRQLGKTVWVLHNPDTSDRFTDYFEGVIAPKGYEPDFVVSVDVAALNMLPANAKVYENRIDLAIDHHPSNVGFGKENCIEADKAACGEIVYKICKYFGKLTPAVALPLYVAVSTDTGCFVYSNTSANTHRVAAALLSVGIDYTKVNKRHFRTKSMKRMKLESMLLAGMHYYEEYAAVVVTITLSMLEQLGATEEDLEDIAAFIGQMEGVRHAVTIRELKPGECKLSVRTAADLNASAVCALLGGGGHAAAAGCTIHATPEEAEIAIMDAVKQVKHG